MNSVKLTTLAAILLTVALVSTSRAQPANPCGNQATPPKVTSGAVISPQLAMGGIQYVAGDAVRVQVVTDGCTDLQSIQIGSVTLTPAKSSSGTLPNYYWYSSIDTQNNATAHGYLMWLGFPSIADGSTDEITVTVVRSGGTGTAAYSFPLVHVSAIQPGADAAIGISGAEIQNMFAKALHDKFSGPNNSAVMSGTTVDYEPASLVTYIELDGSLAELPAQGRSHMQAHYQRYRHLCAQHQQFGFLGPMGQPSQRKRREHLVHGDRRSVS